MPFVLRYTNEMKICRVKSIEIEKDFKMEFYR